MKLSKIFNILIKLNIRFLTKISKLSILFTAYMELTTPPERQFKYEAINIVKGNS